MAIVNKFNVNNKQVTLDADIIENMSANDVPYNSSLQYDKNTVGDKFSELESEINVFKETVTEQVNNYKPIVINGNVTNASDEEDLTSVNGLLKFKNRSALNGMGYIILRKDKTFAEQVIQANTIYEIRYNFDLVGSEITIPEGCILKFEGGKVFRGTLVGNYTSISGVKRGCFSQDIILSGTWNLEEINPSFFTDMSDADKIQSAINFGVVTQSPVVFTEDYTLSIPISIKKTITIDGANHKISGMNISSFFSITETGRTYATYGETNNLQIKNIKFDATNAQKACGIYFENATISYSCMSNLTFIDFRQPCFLFSSSKNSNDINYAMYAHNLIIEHIYTQSCSSIIGQNVSAISDKYFYGGILNDVHFESKHHADNNPYILNLSEFRNFQINNLILESSFYQEEISEDKPKKSGIIYLDRPNTIKNIYFEFQGDDTTLPINSICISGKENMRQEIENIYGTLKTPILLKNVDLYISWANKESMEKIGKTQEIRDNHIGHLVDTESSLYKVHVKNAYYGSIMKSYGGSYPTNVDIKQVDNTLYNESICLDSSEGLTLTVDDSEPWLSIDLSELKSIQDISDTNIYKNVIGIWKHNSITDPQYTYSKDRNFGNILTLASTDTKNYLNCGIQFIHGGLELQEGEYFTFVVTVRQDSIPQVDGNNSYFFCDKGGKEFCFYGNRLRQKDGCITFIAVYKYNTPLDNSLFKFDFVNSTDTIEIPQVVTILDISFFKGVRYGKCKSKLLTEPSY